jgi:hypothetical protein
MGVPVISIGADTVDDHFGWLGRFAGMDMLSSSAWTRRTLGWRPNGPGLLEDLKRMDYSVPV